MSRSRVRPDGVVVVTGASSGIGRATAHAFAARGARVVLAARSESSLHEVAQECRDRGGNPLVVVTDVTDERQVQALADRAVRHFGRIDVWVSVAGVMSYGTFEHTPTHVFRKVVETNLFGQVHCARAVLPQFRAQHAGVLVMVASLYAKMTSPYVSSYVTSKFGVLGLAEVLRQELQDVKGIDVCTILPGSFDTPIFTHAANYTGRQPRPVPPVGDPGRVAAAIVRAVEQPDSEIIVGRVQHLISLQHLLAPKLYNRVVGPAMRLGGLRRRAAPTGDGTVFAPQPATNAVSGKWRHVRRRLLGKAAVGAAVVGFSAAVARSLEQRR